MTPKIKFLLQRKNRLLRRGHVEKVESIGKRVTKAIEKVTSSTFTSADHKSGTKVLWDQVSQHIKKSTATNSHTGVTGQNIPPAGIYPGLKLARLDNTRVYYGLGQFIPRRILWPRPIHTSSGQNIPS